MSSLFEAMPFVAVCSPGARFTDVGDSVLVSSAERDSELSGVVLKAGRTLVALVPDLSRLQPFTEDLASACNDATKTGLWSKILTADKPQKMVGGFCLPVNVPERNVPSAVLDDMATRQEGPDGSPALQVAQKTAASKGLEIKVRTSWDGGTSPYGSEACLLWLFAARHIA